VAKPSQLRLANFFFDTSEKGTLIDLHNQIIANNFNAIIKAREHGGTSQRSIELENNSHILHGT